MCKFPKYRFPVPEDAIRRDYKAKYGFSNRSHAFIWDKRNKLMTSELSSLFSDYIDLLEEIPCGQCLECRIASSRQLAQRALAESTMHESSWFVTLTYDDEHIGHTYRETISRLFGDFGVYPCLVKRDFQLFAKNLRQTVAERSEKEIVIFYCGEYGPEHGRPHFHAIIYGLQLHDLELRKTEGGISYFTSKTISDAWKDYEHEGKDARPRGFHLVTEVNWDTCAYVARYVTKKMIGKSDKDYKFACDALHCEPQLREFHQGPKRPGLGLTYLQAHMDSIYELDKVVLPGGKVMQPCHYYDQKYDIEYPGSLEPIKKERKRVSKLNQMRQQFGMTEAQIEAAEQRKHEIFERKYSKLKVRQDF